MSPRRAVHLLTFIAAVAVAAAVAVQTDQAQARLETTARAHAMRLATVVAAAAQAAHDAPKVMDEALSAHMAAQAVLLLELGELAGAAKISDRDFTRRLEAVLARAGLKTLWWTDGKGVIRARADNGENAAATAAALWPSFAKAAAQPGAPLVEATRRNEEDGQALRMAGLVAKDGRGGAVVGADGAKLAELARLLGVDGLIDGVLGAQAADSLWLLDRDGQILAQGAMVAQAGGAFADPEPAAAGLARDAIASGKAAALVDYGGAVDGVFAAAPLLDRAGERLGAALIRLPLDGRRTAERAAAAAVGLALAALLSAGLVLGRLVDA